VTGPDLASILGVSAASCDVVVVSLTRQVGELSVVALEAADHVLEVLSLDVLSFRASTRAIEAFTSLGIGSRVGFVVNRASRSEITPGDVERVFGAAPLVVIPTDRAIPRAQDRGRLVPPKGRVGRAFASLAERLHEGSQP
jgi:Flp pilus assembly CpaE family ATPase